MKVAHEEVIRTRLDFALHRPLKVGDEIHLESVYRTKEIRVHCLIHLQSAKTLKIDPAFSGLFIIALGKRTQHLIRLTEAERKLILVHELAILLRSFSPHLDR